MKGQNVKKIRIKDISYEINSFVKQEINPIIGKLYSIEELETVLDRVIDTKKFTDEKKENEVIINNATATFHHVNLIVKSYLMYILSMIEAKMRTFFEVYIIKTIIDDLPSTNIAEIKDEYWIENLFINKRKFNDFKHKFNIYDSKKTPRIFFKDMTMGEYTFILTRLKKKHLELFFSRTKDQLKENFVYEFMHKDENIERELATFRKSLKVVKELRNYIIHRIIILDPLIFESICDKEKPDKPLIKNEDKIDYIFDSINLVMADMGYNQIGNRISRHIDREITSKNKKFNKTITLDIKQLNLLGFYKKKTKKKKKQK